MDIINTSDGNSNSKLLELEDQTQVSDQTALQNEESNKSTVSNEFMKLEKAVVKCAKGFYLHVKLKSEQKGRIHISEISDNVINGSRPLTTFKRGQDLTVITLGETTVKNDEGLVITKAHARQTYIDCSLRESVISGEKNAFDGTFVVGDTVTGFVFKHTKSWVHFYLTPTVIGVVNLINLSYNFKVHDSKNLKRHFKIGHAYSAKIIKKRKNVFEMSLIRPEDMKIGAIVAGRILSTRRNLGLLLKLPLDYKGKVHLTDMCDTYQYSMLLLADLFENNIVKCAVLDVDTTSKDAVVSLRDSRIGKLEEHGTINDKEYEFADFHVNMEVRGFVISVSKKSLVVTIARDVIAMCPNNHLIPSYLQVLGAVVLVKISKIENEVIHGNVVLSNENESMKSAIGLVEKLSKKRQADFEESQAKRLKTSSDTLSFNEAFEIQNSSEINISLEHLEECPREIKRKLDNTVTLISDESIIQDSPVKLSKSQRKKLRKHANEALSSSEIAKNQNSSGINSSLENLEECPREIKKKLDNTVTLISDKSIIQDSPVKLPKSQRKKLRKHANEALSSNENAKNQNIQDVVSNQSKEPQSKSKKDSNILSNTNGKIQIQSAPEIKDENTKILAHLQVSTGFVWDLNTVQTKKDNDDSSEDENDGAKMLGKKKKLTRYLEEKSEEDRLRKVELQLLDSTREPETVDDFDKLVLGSPNSSIIWLKYMAFHLQSTEIDKARTIAERALKTISFREEQEKLNVWVALLNLENLYGTPESMQKVFQRALQYNEPLKIYRHVSNIYIQSNKREAAEQLYSVMIKKFSTNIEVWINYAIYLMKNDQLQAAHKLMDRSLKSLAKKDHLSLISKFAQLEFKYGNPERANTLFESMLASYSKRTDIWSVYVDVLVKSGHIEKARDIYRKALTVAFSFKKMKFFFPKYLEFEKHHGNNETLNYAKDKMLEFEQLDHSKFNVDLEDD